MSAQGILRSSAVGVSLESSDATRQVQPTSSVAGVGFSENARSREAGAEATREALQRAGVDRCDLVIMFSTGKHDPAMLVAGVRSIVGPQPRVFGGYGDGVITTHHVGYDGYQVAVGVVASRSIQIDLFLESGLPNNEFEVGVALGRQIKNAQYAGEPNLVVLYDTIKEWKATGASMNMATPLLAGIAAALGKWPPTVGGGSFGGQGMLPGYQWFDDRVVQGSAMALAFSGGVHMDTLILHGFSPTSGYYSITKAEGNVVLELDGQPAADVIGQLIGSDADWRSHPVGVILGVNLGDRFGKYIGDQYLVRSCQAVDETRGGLAMFNDDLQAGMHVQLMRVALHTADIERRVRDFLDRIGTQKSIFALYFDCAARQSRWAAVEGAATEQEEAEIIQLLLGPEIPLLGMYTAGEVARASTQMEVQAHNITGVLSIFSEQ